MVGAGAAVLVLGIAASPASATPISNLEGRWTGWGSIVRENGTSEQVKCIATYFVGQQGATLQQNLRCASASYRIDAVAELEVKSGVVSGRWEERANAASGTVSGRMTGEGFNLAIQGAEFSAAMAVAGSACKQSINIAPRGVDIARISIGLGKC